MTEPTLAELRAFATVAAHRSFRAAGRAGGVSASSVSHAVAGLERRLGTRLFNRTTRSVALTDAGREFLSRVQPALREIETAVEGVNAHRGTPAGVLRLNGSEAAFERLLPALVSFAADYPDMRVDVVPDGRLIDIVAEGFDAGLRLAESVPQDMIALPLGRDEALIIVASPGYLAGRTAPETPTDILSHDCVRVRLPGGGVMRWEFERRGEASRLDPPGRLTLGGDHLARHAALAGAGLACVTAWSAASDLAGGRLVQVLDDWTPPFPGLCLYYPRQRAPSAGLQAFTAHLRARRTA